MNEKKKRGRKIKHKLVRITIEEVKGDTNLKAKFVVPFGIAMKVLLIIASSPKEAFKKDIY